MITVSIVLYKTDIKLLNKVIDSVFNSNLNIVLIIVDNSPTEELNLFKDYPKIEYIFNPSNPGYGAGHNIAIRKAFLINSEFHLIINPDVYFQNGTLERIVDFMRDNNNIGLLMPKVLYPDNSVQYLCKKSPNLFLMFLRSGFVPFLKDIFIDRLNKFEYKDHDYNQIIFNVPYLSGCFMFIRTSEFKKTGIFDERFFLHFEDADLSRRFYLYSNTVYFSDSYIYHHHAALTHKSLKFKLITISSGLKYFIKWYLTEPFCNFFLK